VALIGIERKSVLLDVLAVANQAVSSGPARRAAHPLRHLAIAANAPARSTSNRFGRIQVY